MLNQSYEPISVCNVEKAVILIYLSKAEIVTTDDGRVIRSVNARMPFPSIIRLTHYKRIPYKNIILSRKNILRRDGHRCQYCGTTTPPITVDHILPKALGGRESWENLVAACIRCNNIKSNRTPEKAGFKLRSVPRRPTHVTFIIHSVGTMDDRWRPYLFMP